MRKAALIPGILLLAITSAWAVSDKSVSAEEMRAHPRVQEAIQLLEIWLDAQKDYERLPGLSMGVVYDQDMIWSSGLGYADPSSQRAATPATLYSICSISKLFTSVGVMQLRDAGYLRLDDPVSRHIPWFEIERTFPDSLEVTVESLLTHSSGLPRESNHPYWTGPDFPFPARQEIIEEISKQQTLYPARKYFQYSNLGLTLAGELIHQTSGQEFDTYMREKILNPLNLEDTHPEIPVALADSRMAVGFGPLDRTGTRQKMPLFEARGIAPAAGFASTVEDLGRFASWQFRLLEESRKEVLDANTLREMHRVHWVDSDWSVHWGLGFAVWRDNDKTFVGHGGSCPGFRSHVSLDTAGKVAAIFMTNAMGVNVGRYTGQAHNILGKVLIEAAQAAEEAGEEAPPSDLDLGKYTGLYRSAWGEAAVIPWKGKLAVISLPTEDPLERLTRLEHQKEDTFRRVRDNEELGEEWRFEFLDDGRIRLWQHGNAMERVREY